MQDKAGFYSPLQYQPQWLWLGLVLVLLTAAWYAWILFSGRNKAPAPKSAQAGHSTPVPDLETLRAACLNAINATAEDADAGRLPERDAHQRFSYLVREFAGEAAGLPLTSMTLEDLRRHEFTELSAGIASLYPNEFAPRPVHSVRESAEAAARVVLAWN